jgi:hypothetical protein
MPSTQPVTMRCSACKTTLAAATRSARNTGPAAYLAVNIRLIRVILPSQPAGSPVKPAFARMGTTASQLGPLLLTSTHSSPSARCVRARASEIDT